MIQQSQRAEANSTSFTRSSQPATPSPGKQPQTARRPSAHISPQSGQDQASSAGAASPPRETPQDTWLHDPNLSAALGFVPEKQGETGSEVASQPAESPESDARDESAIGASDSAEFEAEDKDLVQGLSSSLGMGSEEAEQLLENPDAVQQVASWDEQPPLHPPGRINADAIISGKLESDDPRTALGETLGKGSKGKLPYREQLEATFGRDLGDIDVVEGEDATLEQMGAKAATVGGAIVLPSSPSKELVAHEVTHALQDQEGSASSDPQRQVSRPGDASEREADMAVEAVRAGQPADVKQKSSAPVSRSLGAALRVLGRVAKAAWKWLRRRRVPKTKPKTKPKPKPKGTPNPYRKMTREQVLKSKRNYERLLKEHQQKLKDYKRDPFAHDNKGKLQGKSPEVQQKIIQGRIRELQRQINKHEGELEKIAEALRDM